MGGLLDTGSRSSVVDDWYMFLTYNRNLTVTPQKIFEESSLQLCCALFSGHELVTLTWCRWCRNQGRTTTWRSDTGASVTRVTILTTGLPLLTRIVDARIVPYASRTDVNRLQDIRKPNHPTIKLNVLQSEMGTGFSRFLNFWLVINKPGHH